MTASHASILSDDHIRAIGSLVVEVSKLDSVLTDLSAILMDCHVLQAIIAIHHQQTANKIDTLKALADLAFTGEDAKEAGGADDVLAWLLDLLGKAKTVNDYRSSVVHAYWTVDDTGTAYAVRFSARGKLRRTKTPHRAEEIQKRADEARAFAAELGRFRDHMLESRERRAPRAQSPEDHDDP
jgi:hypothetical protein